MQLQLLCNRVLAISDNSPVSEPDVAASGSFFCFSSCVVTLKIELIGLN